MNYIQKQAALQKLAQVRLAINYVMRNRGMKKQAEGGLSMEPYGTVWENQRKFEDPLTKYDTHKKTGPYSPYFYTRQVRDSDTPVGPNTLGGLTNQVIQRFGFNQLSPDEKWDRQEHDLKLYERFHPFSPVHPHEMYNLTAPDPFEKTRYDGPQPKLRFSGEYMWPERRAQSLIPTE